MYVHNRHWNSSEIEDMMSNVAACASQALEAGGVKFCVRTVTQECSSAGELPPLSQDCVPVVEDNTGCECFPTTSRTTHYGFDITCGSYINHMKGVYPASVSRSPSERFP